MLQDSQQEPQFYHQGRLDLGKTVAVKHNGQAVQRMILSTVNTRACAKEMVALKAATKY